MPPTITIINPIKGLSCNPEAKTEAPHNHALEIAPNAATDST